MRAWIVAFISFFAVGLLTAQPQPVRWSAKLVPTDIRAGESGQIVMTATVEMGWHVYSTKVGGDLVPTTLNIEPGGMFMLSNPPVEPTPTKAFDENFNMPVEYHVGSTSFGIPVSLDLNAKGSGTVVATVKFQACNDTGCLPPQDVRVPVKFTVAEGPARPERIPSPTTVPDQPSDHEAPPANQPDPSQRKDIGKVAGEVPVDPGQASLKQAQSEGLFSFFLFAFGAGLLALLTPCVFPMVPITVSYFTKQKSEAKGGPIKLATAYCLGIIATFTGLGLVMTAVFGAAGIQVLATNPFVNIGIAALFIFLAFNLFGVFELKLPNWIVNRANTASRTQSGLLGPVLMGLTFSLTTFTCTVPFVGGLLAGAATGGYLYPAVGMLGFGLALSIPFFFLAIFPQYLSKLPKSGSWLATTKAFMGFLELVAALKFLSNVDLVWQWGILTRPVFLAVWVLLFGLAALYLFGWLKLGHEAESVKIGWLRRVFAVATLATALFCLNGLRGGSLGELASFLPPDPYPGQKGSGPASIAWQHDYKSALIRAKAENKQLFLNFTGVTCTNCRWMEQNMFSKPEVASAIQDYIPVEMYTDRTTKEDLENREIQQRLTGQITLPVYVLIDADENVLGIFPGITRDESEYLKFLRNPKEVAGR